MTHRLNLIKFNGNSIQEIFLARLSVSNEFYNIIHIPLHEIYECSYDVNPVHISLFLAIAENENFLIVDKKNLTPCDISPNDTIYLNEALNRENVIKELWPRPAERKFKNYLAYFKHPHIKLKKYDFTLRAISALRNNESFYFYYYEPGYNTYNIIDVNNMKVVFFAKAPRRVFLQSKRFVKRSSKISKACKKLK